jgi:hypothetical protein
MGFCLFCALHSNDKMIRTSAMTRAAMLRIATVASLCAVGC